MKKFFSFAKINVGLEVLNRRSDGYHDIATIFVPISLHDQIIVEPSDKFQITCKPELDVPIEKNLVYKTIEIIKNKHKLNNINYKIHIKKNIPTGAGLGGGSSNAAVTIRIMNELFNINMNYEDMKNIAIELGSDVPYFLNNSIAIGLGRGEKLKYLNLPWDWYTLIINPGINISTAWAYSELDRTNNNVNDKDIINRYSDIFTNKNYKKNVTNDFEAIVFNKYPEIRNIKEEMYKMGAAFSLMSGSGSTVYGLFDNLSTAKKAQDYFNNFFTYLSNPIKDFPLTI